MSTDESVRAGSADDAADDDVPDDVAGRRRLGGKRRRDVPTDSPPPVLAKDGDGPTTPEPPTYDDPRFWHRDHPVFTPLAGFFTGVLTVVVVLGLLGAILDLVVGYDVSEHPWVFLLALGVLLVVNLVLVLVGSTRRFARYMLFGILTTPAVVAAAGGLTFYVLIGR